MFCIGSSPVLREMIRRPPASLPPSPISRENLLLDEYLNCPHAAQFKIVVFNQSKLIEQCWKFNLDIDMPICAGCSENIDDEECVQACNKDWHSTCFKPAWRWKKVFEDAKLETLLDQDSCQMQQELAGSLGVTQQAISKCLKVMGMIQKQGNWVPYELKPRDVEQHLFACEQLLARQRRKGFLHRIVTG
ncbi:mariner Mos1 transposase [Trichonephila clavipes]|nr:mariner Mos1 transposase [Trichonephila clavipes]